LSNPLITYLAIMLAMAITSHVLAAKVPYLRDLVDPYRSRNQALDAFRGLLATGVFVHHAAIHLVFLRTHDWDSPSSPFLAFLGEGSVAFFFMISGFLFWAKSLDRPSTATGLWINRFWRIMPLYWFAAACFLVAAFSVSGFQLRESPAMLLSEIVRWTLGGIGGAPHFNGISPMTIHSVTWTLRFEWVFYFALPLLAIVLKSRRRFIVAVFVYLAILAVVPFSPLSRLMHPLSLGVYFLCGMAAAYLERIQIVRIRLRSRQFALLSAAWLVGGLVLFEWLNRTSHAFYFFPIFLAVTCGNDVLGLLSAKWIVLLGHLSYSIYLLHSLVLFSSLRLLAVFVPTAELSTTAYWACILLVAALVVLLSSITYRFIEAPFFPGTRHRDAAPVPFPLPACVKSGSSA